MMKLHRRAVAGGLVAALAFAGAACSDDDDEPAETGSAPEESTTTAAPEEEPEETTTTAPEEEEPAGEAVEVTAIEYEFQGLPESVPAGTQLSLTNSGAEPHELVALAIPETETRTIDELAALPPEELGAVFAGPPGTVIIAMPGDTDTLLAEGDGTLTEPGRYAIVCTFPVGVTVEEIQNATGPLDPAGRPTHDQEGMYAEVIVE